MLAWLSLRASLSSSGSAWNSREAAKAASIVAGGTPWPVTYKKPTRSLASRTWAATRSRPLAPAKAGATSITGMARAIASGSFTACALKMFMPRSLPEVCDQRQHFAGKQRHRALPGLARLPLVGDGQHHAEAADRLVQGGDLLGDGPRRADQPDVVAQVLECHLGVRHGRIGLEHVEAAQLGQQSQEILAIVATQRAVDGLAARLLVGVGHVHVARDAPGGAVGPAAGAGGARFDRFPVRLQDARRHEVDGHRQVAALAGQAERLRLRRHAGHADRRVRLLIRLQVQAQADVVLVLGDAEAPA